SAGRCPSWRWCRTIAAISTTRLPGSRTPDSFAADAPPGGQRRGSGRDAPTFPSPLRRRTTSILSAGRLLRLLDPFAQCRSPAPVRVGLDAGALHDLGDLRGLDALIAVQHEGGVPS